MVNRTKSNVRLPNGRRSYLIKLAITELLFVCFLCLNINNDKKRSKGKKTLNITLYILRKFCMVNRPPNPGLQLLQIMAARFVSGAPKFDHTSPLLVKLHWLPISYHVVFKLLFRVFKALNGAAHSIWSNYFSTRIIPGHFVQIL